VAIVVPEKSDHHFVSWAGQSLFAELVQAGVEIHQRRLPFIHSKAMVIDRSWVLLGSANLDYRSLRLNFELNLEVTGDDFVEMMAQTVNSEIAQSHMVTIEELNGWHWSRKIRNNFCALFAPIL